jgi:hypothetical protein
LQKIRPAEGAGKAKEGIDKDEFPLPKGKAREEGSQPSVHRHQKDEQREGVDGHGKDGRPRDELDDFQLQHPSEIERDEQEGDGKGSPGRKKCPLGDGRRCDR